MSVSLRYIKSTVVFVLLAVAYLLQTSLTHLTSATLDKYHISNRRGTLLLLTVAIPYVLVWFVALVGYIRLNSYANAIKSSKDGKAFRIISLGLLWLALYLPISAVFGNFVSHVYTLHPHLTPVMVRLDNYVNVVLLFPVFIFINNGSKQLVSLVKKPVFTSSQSLTLLYIAFSALYVLIALHDPARRLPTRSVSVASYYQPDWLIVLTLIIPQLWMWFLGLQGIQNIYRYRLQVKGTIYKHALRSLAFGTAGVVFIIILLRCLESLSSALERLNLGLVLLLLYVLVLLVGVSYLFVAGGAKKLHKIEEL